MITWPTYGIHSMKLSIAIVSYHSDVAALRQALDSLVESIRAARDQFPALQADFYLIDNDPAASTSGALASELMQLKQRGFHGVDVIRSGKNLGYGAGHNQCLQSQHLKLDSQYHLILNPDVILERDFIEQGLLFMEADTDVVAVAPYVENEKGEPTYLCKRYPTVLDLWLRGFMPSFIQHWFGRRLAHYQMQDVYELKRVNRQIPIISGCCMLVRSPVFCDLQGFDPRFFLYFEDFDLSLRMAQKGRVAYNPAMRIQHLGGFSAKKGLWHIQQFARSGKQFFDKHGWRWS
jgi:GT2 family glycosyltransferase